MISKFQDFINEDTSSTGGSSISGSVPSSGGVALANTSISGMGPVQSSQPSSFPGALNGTNWINGGGESGSGDITVPYNPSGANRMFQKIPSPMGKNHGAKTGKKSREKKLDLKNLRDMLKNRPKSGGGKIMNFDNFAKKDITTKVTKVEESIEGKNESLFSKKQKDDKLENINGRISNAAYSLRTFGTMTKPAAFINGAKWAVHNLSNEEIKYLKENGGKDDFSFFGF